jgi:hypothetical protein
LTNPELVPRLRQAVEDHTAGSPVEPGHLWTNRSPGELADELGKQGHAVDPKTVRRLLKEALGLSRRQMVKTLSMGESADREAQFQQLQRTKAEFLEQGYPVLSVDTKKKELLGKFHRPGPAWTNGRVRAWDHDFPSSAWGKVIPYGVYDLARNEALVYLAQGADTGQLAVDAVRRWWHRLGKWHYPANAPLLLLADCGGSNGYRIGLFRQQLQQLANGLGKVIHVCHLPPYCSKYNPIDHRLFCHLSRSLKSLLLQSIEFIRQAIARTTTRQGLRVVAELARKLYPSGVKASLEYLHQETVIRHQILPQFNYRFEPQ